MNPFTITIPGDPNGKARARVTRKGFAYTPAKTRNAEVFIKMIAAEEMAGRTPMDGPVSLTMRAVMVPAKSWSKKKQAAALTGEIRPTKKPDVDNILKLVKDALNGIVYGDDAQVVRVEAEKVYGPQALTVVTVKPIEQSEGLRVNNQ